MKFLLALTPALADARALVFDFPISLPSSFECKLDRSAGIDFVATPAGLLWFTVRDICMASALYHAKSL